jgi:hypothetical protein
MGVGSTPLMNSLGSSASSSPATRFASYSPFEPTRPVASASPLAGIRPLGLIADPREFGGTPNTNLHSSKHQRSVHGLAVKLLQSLAILAHQLFTCLL